MFDTIQIISFVITIITGSFTILFTISEPFRKRLLNQKQEKKKEEENQANQKETDKCLLRDRITNIYFKHYRECEMREYEYENVSYLYKQYKKLDGNSFVDKIWREMQEWKILP